MKVVIVTGSHRTNSESKRIADVLKSRFLGGFNEIVIHELAQMIIPFWDQGVWSGEEKWTSILTPIKADMQSADAFVVITPEWGGMVPPMLKNYFLLAGHAELGNKPAMIVSISAGAGGAYPVNELRTSAYKNNKICFIPDHLVYRGVKSLFAEDNSSEAMQEMILRTEYTCNLLVEYAKALKPIRSLDLPFEKYPYGM